MFEKMNKDKIKHFLMLFVGVVILSLISYQDFKLKQEKRISDISSINQISERKVSPKALFIESWQIIKSNYYRSDLNKQNWAYWKKRYIHLLMF